METTNTSSETITPRANRPLKLRIVGADLLLAGRFAHWMPLALTDGQGGKGETGDAVQVLVDVTSPCKETDKEADLLTFTSHSVRAVGPQAYKVKGKLVADGVSRGIEAFVQSPTGHTPFLVITLPLDREGHTELWADLEGRVSRAVTSAENEVRPWAWLRAPELAAA